MTDQRKRPSADERTDDLYPAMQRRNKGMAAHTPDTSDDKASDSGNAASLEGRKQRD